MKFEIYGLTLKEYIVHTLREVSSLESDERRAKEVSFDVWICPQFNEKTKEWDIMVVEEGISASRIKFSVKI